MLEHQLEAMVEESEYIAHVAGVLERRPLIVCGTNPCAG